MKDIAQEIKRIRKEHNLTQQQFAVKIYVSRQAVSKYERNQCMPNVDVINKVKELFGEDLNSIIEVTPSVNFNDVSIVTVLNRKAEQ